MRLLELKRVALGIVLVLELTARADEPATQPATPSGVLGADPADRAGLESFAFRFGYFTQSGHGFQSADGPPQGPGNEAAIIWEPEAIFRLRESRTVYHDIVVPVDIVTAASPDAIDALTSASRTNEAGGADITTHIQTAPDTSIGIRYGFHLEEPLRSANAGFIYTRSLADDNATLEASLLASFDFFDNLDHQGFGHGQVIRTTVNLNLSGSQILSPTTLLDGSYGLTIQAGTLQTTYNGVPVTGSQLRVDELLPSHRLRHALAARLSQHIPMTRTTLKLSYRFYIDDFGLVAHTGELRAYQWLAGGLYVRGSVRLYTQTGVDYFTTSFPRTDTGFRTADSDLAPFDSNELGVALELAGDHSPWRALAPIDVGASFTYYKRSNDLQATILGMSLGWRFR